jgi:hypothetical protein
MVCQRIERPRDSDVAGVKQREVCLQVGFRCVAFSIAASSDRLGRTNRTCRAGTLPLGRDVNAGRGRLHGLPVGPRGLAAKPFKPVGNGRLPEPEMVCRDTHSSRMEMGSPGTGVGWTTDRSHHASHSAGTSLAQNWRMWT